VRSVFRGRTSLRRALSALVAAIGLMLAILIAAAIYGTVSTARDYRTGSQEAVARQDAAAQVLVTLLNAQTANRGYALARRGVDLRQYLDARDRYPDEMRRLRAEVTGEPELERLADRVDTAALAWFADGVRTIQLLRQERFEAAIDRVNRGIGEARFRVFRLAHDDLVEEVEEVRLEALDASDASRRVTLALIVGAAVLALAITGLVSRALWIRIGGPVALLAEGVRRVAGGRLTEPVPASSGSVRELEELVSGFNTMQRQVREERETVAAAARREAAQKTERHLWETVQAGLLPERLAGVPGLRVAARYQPAERALLIGGDFYDSVALPDGRLALLVGDMAGHGAQSAARAAGLRFGWRTLIAVNPNPAAVMAALNVQMRGPGERAQGLFASLIYVLIDPRGAASVATAGHPPPLLLTPAGCRPLRAPATGPLLGIMDDPDWPTSHVTLPPGGTLMLYSDGLIEARRGDDDTFGISRACTVLEVERASALEARVERVIDAARRYDDEALRDDVVVLAVERPMRLAGTPRPPATRLTLGDQPPAPPDGSADGTGDGAAPAPAPARPSAGA
jgi:serine phosphatase RsbU (regulator of sigma subunit)/CHASE3 domain sensor protein